MEVPDLGEGGSLGAGGAVTRRPLEALIEGEEGRAPMPRAAAVAGLTTAAAVAAKLVLDLEAWKRRGERVRDTTPDLPEGYVPSSGGDALGLGVETRGPDLPPVRGDVLGTERRVGRAAADAQAHAQAVEKRRQELERILNGVPRELRESEQWKKRVAPLLDRARKWTDTSRIWALSERIKAIVDARRRIENSPTLRKLPRHHQEALIWYRRVSEVLGETTKQYNERLFIDPAVRVLKPIPGVGKPIARKLERHRKESAEFIDRMKDLPIDISGNGFRAQQRHQGSDPIVRDLWKYKRQRRNFESGWEKLQRWRRELGEWWDRVRFGIRKKR
jgi:hypothetical protein